MPIGRHLPLILVLALAAGGCAPATDSGEDALTARSLLGQPAAGAFARADTPRHFRFPDDHGPHPDFQTEWWYLTGNLADAAGRRFGFQATFFRFALTPDRPQDASPWRTRDAWMAHFAITDVAGSTHHRAERFARGTAGLAGAQSAPFAVWLDDWRFEADPAVPGRWRLSLQAEDFSLSLTLSPSKPPVLQGDAGLSQKSASPGNASYYYSLTRIDAEGRLTLREQPRPVTGTAWLDREWSTSALSREQAGWDWFALQLADGRELMFYRLRRVDGGTDPHSAGTLVARGGVYRRLRAEEMQLEPLRHWQAPDGRSYPVEWRMQLPEMAAPWRIRPVLDDQEMDLSVRYWEGAVDVLDADGRHIGVGYVELAGYD